MRDLNGIHLSSLRAVEAVARLGTLGLAAEELGVTPGAVSQQIIKAEARLNVRLFERRPKGLEPTVIGRQLAKDLTRGFQAVASGVVAIKRPKNEITLSVAPVLAGKWLMWRLADFHRNYPDLRVRIEASVDLVDPNDGAVDACLRIGRGPWSGVKSTHLFEQQVFPVCSPEIARQVSSPKDLLDHPAIREPAPMFGWEIWLNQFELENTPLKDGPMLTDASLCLDAAAAGQGIFLAWETLASDALRDGRIVAPFPEPVPTGLSYWWVEPNIQTGNRGLKSFQKWLFDEVSS